MANELIVIEPTNVLTVFTSDNGLDEIIKQVEMEVMTFEHDLSNDARRKKTASLARKVASTKTYLDNLGKELVSDWKNKAKVVDANRKDMRDRLDELRDLARKPLTDWEEEQARIEEEARLAEEAEKLRIQIESDHEIALLMNEKFDREAEEAFLKAQAEEELRIEAEEKERLAREEQIRKEAEEKAKREAIEREQKLEQEKQAAIEREKQAERDRIAAEERAKLQAEQAEIRRKQEAEQAEKRRLADIETAKQAEIQRQKDEEARQKAEQEKREANRKYVGKIRGEAKESLMALGIDEEKAKEIVLAISSGQIKNVTINY